MKLAYIANARLPTEKAHGIQIMKMCEAFAMHCTSVELFVPERHNSIAEDPFEYYRVKKTFSILRIRCFDTLSMAWINRISLAYWIEIFSFALFLSWHWGKKIQDCDVVYTRDLWSVIFLPRPRLLVYEAHNIPKKITWLYRHLLKRINKFIVITQGLKEDFTKLGVSPDRILVVPDAVDIEQFSIPASSAECRQKLGLPLDRKIVMYTGHLYIWKGVYTVLAAAKLLPEILFVFVGGTAGDLTIFQQKATAAGLKNVLIIGHRKHEEIPYFLKAADVLLLPNSATERISERYTSPLKLFEYMAAGVPIVASHVASLLEILDDSTAYFFEPDNPASLAATLQDVMTNYPCYEVKVQRAYEKVIEKYSWRERAELIISLIFSKQFD